MLPQEGSNAVNPDLANGVDGDRHDAMRYDGGQQQPRYPVEQHAQRELVASSRVEPANMIRQDLQSEIVSQIQQRFQEHQDLNTTAPKSSIPMTDSRKRAASPSEDPTAIGEDSNVRLKWIITAGLVALAIGLTGLVIGLRRTTNKGEGDGIRSSSTSTPSAPMARAPTNSPSEYILPNRQGPSSAPTDFVLPEPFYTLMEMLKPPLMGPPTCFQESSFLDPFSIQYQVLSWMTNEDEETGRILTLFTTRPEYQLQLILKRYCAYSLYLRWGGGEWTRLPRPALQTISICLWNDGRKAGIFCVGGVFITAIDLLDNNLHDPLLPPSEAAGFFIMPDNFLTGTISPAIAEHLPNLTHLIISGTELTGTLPTELGSLSNLQHFSAC